MTNTPPHIGQRIGTYELQALLGSGGMAVVYRGFDHNLQRPVAVKLLADAIAAQPGIAERFQREARVIARLHHPYIVQVYDYGEADGRAYMVQELLPGPTLDQQLHTWQASGVQPTRDEVLSIARHIAEALDAAHAAGILHRDVKPSNIMRNASGALVLTDFGIAKTLREDTNLTQTGMIIGTPNYLSPEQAQGQPLTSASDVYSFGIVLYELLAGQPPFSNPTPMGVLLDHVQTPPPAMQPQRPDLPPAVDAVLQRALAKKPQDRYATAGALASALEQAWPRVPARAVPPPSIHNQPTAMWTGASRSAAPAAAPTLADGTAPAVPTAPVAPATPRRRSLLPILLLALLLLLCGGGFLALRAPGQPSSASGDAPTALPAAAVLPTDVTLPPTDAPQPTDAPPATEAPLAATPLPDSPLTVSGALAELRALIVQGMADGQAGPDGEHLLETFEQAQQALIANTQRGINAARIQLLLMQQQIVQNIAANEMDAGFGQSLLMSIDAVANEYNLGLPALMAQPKDAPAQDNGKDNGKQKDDKKKDTGKGNGKDKK